MGQDIYHLSYVFRIPLVLGIFEGLAGRCGFGRLENGGILVSRKIPY